MKNKTNIFYMSLGIGIGIILTSFIFILNPKIKYIDYNDEEIIEKAKQLGMVSVKDKIEINEKNDRKNKKEVKQKEKIFFQIKDDDTLSSVADNLFKKGLIANKEDFIQMAKQIKVDKKLRTGNYNLEKNLSYNEILKILTEKK